MKTIKTLLLIIPFILPNLWADEKPDITGTWKAKKAIIAGKLQEIGAKKEQYRALIGDDTWATIDEEGEKATIYHYKAEMVDGVCRLTISKDKAFKKIESLAIVRIQEGDLEICMKDYSSGEKFPDKYESTKENGCTIFLMENLD